ncbi:MAG: hypothetical protein HND55_02515 [Pseudomonadota bacterium]|nr:MAG: hypothetical protein HND55_02515 [Pseudomonadota bacterium]
MIRIGVYRLLLAAACVAGSCAQALAASALSDDALAAHWHPLTADEARELTLAARLWLEQETLSPDWPQTLGALGLTVAESRQQVAWDGALAADGVFAWLAQSREHNLGSLDAAAARFPSPYAARLEPMLRRAGSAGRLARLGRQSGLEASQVWARVVERLAEFDPAEDDEPATATTPAQLWQPVITRMIGASSENGIDWLSYARRQAGRSTRFSQTDELIERARIRDEMLQDEAEMAMVSGDWLHAVWVAFEGLIRLTATREVADPGGWMDLLDRLHANHIGELRTVDLDLPVTVALLADAASYLDGPEPAVQPAIAELADAYARLALFMPDMAFYLDQPVRQAMRRVSADCDPDPLLVGPLPREVFERCVKHLLDVIGQGLDSEELVGGVNGPFAPHFLRREMGLVSWQRAAYLDGHLNWLLDAPCPPAARANVLEWSLAVENLVRWVPQRPVFFSGGRWQNALGDMLEEIGRQSRQRIEWVDCVTGHGSQRRDPIRRLLELHRTALREVADLLGEAQAEFYQSVVRPGGDIDLDGPASQATAYRPENIAIGPCPQADTCASRIQLPVSRALLGLFPNAYLLADQIGLGDIDLCYERVRWRDRSMAPARGDDPEVANYRGRLGFDLVGTFAGRDGVETVFRHRFVDHVQRHYLFAAADPAILALDCPLDQVGSAVSSRLPDEHPGLVPRRLTYFASAPTTPEAELAANWDQAAEWRDWFITGDRVKQIEASDGAQMEVIVQAELTALAARRERQMTAPLINPSRVDNDDPLALAMDRVADSAALIKRMLELHYPRVIRHHAPVRAMVAGEAGLMTRDRVRALRDSGVAASQMPQIGLDRSGQMESAWLSLSPLLREQGQRAPELDFGIERLNWFRSVFLDAF